VTVHEADVDVASSVSGHAVHARDAHQPLPGWQLQNRVLFTSDHLVAQTKRVAERFRKLDEPFAVVTEKVVKSEFGCVVAGVRVAASHCVDGFDLKALDEESSPLSLGEVEPSGVVVVVANGSRDP
jgi:hypothetical protein